MGLVVWPHNYEAGGLAVTAVLEDALGLELYGDLLARSFAQNFRASKAKGDNYGFLAEEENVGELVYEQYLFNKLKVKMLQLPEGQGN